jgi:Niemann-Pick C1 protein
MASMMSWFQIIKLLFFPCTGIGIDDMFVIMQCWNNLPQHEKTGHSLQEKMAMTMQHAGVAISVTSLTDVFAFGVGAVTVRNNE